MTAPRVTTLEECWKPAFARYLIPKYTGFRLDLERYLPYYNTDRAHTGRWTRGRTPEEDLGKVKMRSAEHLAPRTRSRPRRKWRAALARFDQRPLLVSRGARTPSVLGAASISLNAMAIPAALEPGPMARSSAFLLNVDRRWQRRYRRRAPGCGDRADRQR